MGEAATEPGTSVVFGSIVSEKLTPVASAPPLLVISIVYIIVSPGLTGVLGLAVLVAVSAAPKGEAAATFNIIAARGSLAGWPAGFNRLLLKANRSVASGESDRAFGAAGRVRAASGGDASGEESERTFRPVLRATKARTQPSK